MHLDLFGALSSFWSVWSELQQWLFCQHYLPTVLCYFSNMSFPLSLLNSERISKYSLSMGVVFYHSPTVTFVLIYLISVILWKKRTSEQVAVICDVVHIILFRWQFYRKHKLNVMFMFVTNVICIIAVIGIGGWLMRFFQGRYGSVVIQETYNFK